MFILYSTTKVGSLVSPSEFIYLFLIYLFIPYLFIYLFLMLDSRQKVGGFERERGLCGQP